MQRICLNWKGAVPVLAALLMLALGAGTGSRRLAACQSRTAPTPAGEHRHSLEKGRS